MSQTTLLIENLARQCSVYDRLHRCFASQQEALADRNVDQVHDILQDIERILMERSQLEMQRSQLLLTMAREYGVEPDALTLEMIIQDQDPAESARLQELSAQLKDIIGQLQPMISHNDEIVRQELTLIEQVVSMATTTEDPTPYGRKGAASDDKQEPTPKLQLLDMKV